MPVLALINDHKTINLVLPWASAFTRARDSSLVVLCWTQSTIPSSELPADEPVSEHLVLSLIHI